MILVVDASVTITWLVDDEDSAYADAALAALKTDRGIVPAIWHWEISNTLMILERKGRLHDAIAIYLKVAQFPITIEHLEWSHDRRAVMEIELARKHLLSVYDAAYLAIAKVSGHKLATLDVKLGDAARKEDVFFVA